MTRLKTYPGNKKKVPQVPSAFFQKITETDAKNPLGGIFHNILYVKRYWQLNFGKIN